MSRDRQTRASAGTVGAAALVAAPAIYFSTAGWVLGLQARHLKSAASPLPPRVSSLLLRFYEPAFFLADRFDTYDRWILRQWDQVDR